MKAKVIERGRKSIWQLQCLCSTGTVGKLDIGSGCSVELRDIGRAIERVIDSLLGQSLHYIYTITSIPSTPHSC